MNTVLFVNHVFKKCGAFQIGKNHSDIIKQSNKYNFIYDEFDDEKKFYSILNSINPQITIFNYNPSSLKFVNREILDNIRNKTKVTCLYHEWRWDGFDYFIHLDPTINEIAVDFKVGRLLLKYDGEYPNNKVPVIGSFGFPVHIKNFDEIVVRVNNEFNEAIIRIHLSDSDFSDLDKSTSNEFRKLFQQYNRKDNIKLEISSGFLTHEELLKFLASNDINVFLYRQRESTVGVSSALDQAMSVRRPIAVSNSTMFRHVFGLNPSVVVQDYHNALSQILKNGLEPLEPLYLKWNKENLIQDYERAFDKILGC